MSKNTKTFWPYGIVLSIIAVIGLCVGTIYISLDYPVEMDNFYFQKHQKIDTDINEILAKQEEFSKNFDVKLERDTISISKDNELKILISSKTGKKTDFTPEILITRPNSNAQNFTPQMEFDGGNLVLKNIVLPLMGRWQIMLKLSNDEFVGFYKMEFFAQR